MAENNTNEVDLGLEEEAQVDLGDTSPTTGTSTTQGTEETPAMSLTEQLAQGLAAAPETPSVERPATDIVAEQEEAELEGMPVDPEANPAAAVDLNIDDIDVITSARDEITDVDLQDIDEGKYDPVIEANEKGFLQEAEEYNAAVVSGLFEGVDQMGNTLADLADWGANLFIDDKDPDAIAKWQENLNFIPDEWEARDKKILESSQGKAFVNTISQFMGGFIPAMKIVKMAQKGAPVGSKLQKAAQTMLGSASAGMAADFAVWNVADKRLVNFMTEFGGDLSAEAAKELEENPDSPEAMTKFKQTVGEALESKWVRSLEYDPENDSKLMGRTKQALEGGFLGKIVDGIALTVKQFGKLKPTKTTEVVEEVTKNNKKKKPGKLKVGKPTEDVLPLKKAKVKLVKQDQEVFNKAFYFDHNVKEAADIIARNLDDSLLDSVSDLDSVRNLSEVIDELIENTHKAGKQSWDQAKAKAGKAYNEATDNLVDPNATEWEKTVAALEEGASKTADLDVQILKEGVIDQAMSRRVLKAKDAVRAGKMTEEAFEELYATALQVYNYVTSTSGNVGRALNARKMFTADGSTSLSTIFKPVKDKGYNSTSQLLDILDGIPEGQAMPKNMLNKLGQPGWIQMGEELFRNSVLSVTSLGVNTTSNLLMMLSRTADMHRSAFGNGSVSHKQAIGHTVAYMSAIPEAFVLMMRSLITDVPQLTSKLDPKYANEFKPNNAIVNTNSGFGQSIQDPKNFFTKTLAGTINTIGKFVRGMPGSTRTMMATDEFFKTLNYRAFVTKEAIASAEQQGINFLTNPKAAAKHIKEVHDKVMDAGPGQKFHGISRDSFKEAHVSTFTEEFSSQSGNKIYEAIRSTPGLAFILPFVRQPVNGLKYFVRSTPGLNMVSSRVDRELAAGGARAELEMARLNLASAAWLVIATDLFSSEEGTKGGKSKDSNFTWDNRYKGAYKKDSPTFAENKDLGIDPNTFRNENGDYVNYRGLEPTASKFVVAAGMMEEWMANMYSLGDKVSKEEYMKMSEEMAYTGAALVLQAVVDQSSVRGMQQMIEFTADPKRFWGMAAGLASPFSGLIKYQREQHLGYDLTRQDPGKSSRGTLANFTEQWINRYGGESVPKLNMFGDPIPRAHPQYLGETLTGKDADWGSGDSLATALANVIPTNVRRTKNTFTEPYQQEIIRVKNAIPGRSAIGTVPKRINNIPIDNKERYNLLTFFKNIKADGQTFGQRMEEVMKSDEYKEASDLSKSENFIKPMYSSYMQAAQQALLDDAAYYYKKGKHQPYTKKLKLQDYDRSESLTLTQARAVGRENNLLNPKNSDNYMSIKEVEQKYQEGDESRTDAVEQLFN